jgi:hypothetical protein
MYGSLLSVKHGKRADGRTGLSAIELDLGVPTALKARSAVVF